MKSQEKAGSGKQVLNLILSQLSTKLTPQDQLKEASNALRAGLLLHGSTSDETYDAVSRLIWSSSLDDDGVVNRQGIALANGNVFISDLFEEIIEIPELKNRILQEYPGLLPEDYEAAMYAIWLIISSVQTFTSLLSVETDSAKISSQTWIEIMMKHYHSHFKDNINTDRNNN